MSTAAEKTLFLHNVLARNPKNICYSSEEQKHVTVRSENFDFQTLNFIHNFCNANSGHYSVSNTERGVLLTVNFI